MQLKDIIPPLPKLPNFMPNWVFGPILTAVAATGCTPTETISTLVADKNTSAVVIGMETSKFAGSCPGAKVDSDRMTKLFASYASNVTLLQDVNATYKAVYAAIDKAVKASDLAIIYYSGHGGSQAFFDTGSEETDGHDEFLCLYDTYMRDNDIWSLISKSKGRVFLIFDCCHSATMFKLPRMSFGVAQRRAAQLRGGVDFSMLCWSGCPDDTYSYGDSGGGKMTNTLLKYHKSGISYADLWKLIKSDRTLASYEDAQQTKIGKDFSDKEAFR